MKHKRAFSQYAMARPSFLLKCVQSELNKIIHAQNFNSIFN